MFESTEDFNKAVYNLLVRIRDSKSLYHLDDLNIDGLSKLDYSNIQKHIVNRYVEGLRVVKVNGNNGIGTYKGEPCLTKAGLQFIEDFERRHAQ